jgi:molecular chaperone DnaK
VATPLIERNTTIPTRKSQIFSTAAEMQTQVQINVVQGERPMAADNKQLGTFVLDGIPPAPRGVPQVEVTFDIDADGILHVSAQDKATGREQKITITASSGLNEQEIQNMVRDAEAHVAEDRRRKAEVEKRNQADNMAYSAERTLRDLGDKVPTDMRADVEAKINDVRAALQNNTDNLDQVTEALQSSLQRLGEVAYQQEQGGQSPPPGGQPDADQGDEGTVEGEFREV